MVSQIKVNEIIKQSGSTIGIGETGDTITLTGNTINLGTTGNTVNIAGSAYATAETMTPSFQAYMNGDQTLANTTYTKMEMDTEVYDTDSKYDTSNYRFTPGVAGKYWVWGKFRLDTGTSMAAGIIGVYKNGSLISKFTEGQAHATTKFFGQVITLDADDYIELYGYQNGGGNVTVNGGSADSQDTGHWGAYRITGVT